MDKKPIESIDDKLFSNVSDKELAKVAAGYIVSSSNVYEHTVIHGVVDVEYEDD
jgi:hypothetical protein